MYDAIVVGARCAGSPTAMLLARLGYRVLLLDKAQGWLSQRYPFIPLHSPAWRGPAQAVGTSRQGSSVKLSIKLPDRLRCWPLHPYGYTTTCGRCRLRIWPTPPSARYHPGRGGGGSWRGGARTLHRDRSAYGRRPRQGHPRPRSWRHADHRRGPHRHRSRWAALAGGQSRPGPDLP